MGPAHYFDRPVQDAASFFAPRDTVGNGNVVALLQRSVQNFGVMIDCGPTVNNIATGPMGRRRLIEQIQPCAVQPETQRFISIDLA